MSGVPKRLRAVARAVGTFLLACLRMAWKVVWVTLMLLMAGFTAFFMPLPPPPKPRPPIVIKDEDDEDKDPV